MTNNNSIKIVQHANDCTNLLRDAKSIKKLLKLISEFSEVAWPKLNLEKTDFFINMYADKQYINGGKIAKNCVKPLGTCIY